MQRRLKKKDDYLKVSSESPMTFTIQKLPTFSKLVLTEKKPQLLVFIFLEMKSTKKVIIDIHQTILKNYIRYKA